MWPKQEVQSNHYTDFLQPELAKAGYTAIYKKKTMEIYTGNAYAIDGCATFFKKDRFALVKKYEVRTCAIFWSIGGKCWRSTMWGLSRSSKQQPWRALQAALLHCCMGWNAASCAETSGSGCAGIHLFMHH